MTPASQPGSHGYDVGARRPARVPYLFAIRSAAGDGRRRSGDPPVAARADRHRGARREAGAGACSRRSSSSPSTSATASRSTAGCSSRRTSMRASATRSSCTSTASRRVRLVADRWGGERHALPSRAGRSRLHRAQRRQSRHARAQGRRVAEDRLRHGRRSLVAGAGRGDPRARRRGIPTSIAIASASGAGAAAAPTR